VEDAVSHSIARSVLESGRGALIGDPSTTEPYKRQPSIQQRSPRSVLCAPLVARDEAFALIYMENRQVSDCFTEAEEQGDLLDEACALVAPWLRDAVAMRAQRQAEALEQAHSQSDGILTAESGMTRPLQTVHQIAITDLSVLIGGETGNR
jgi:transcriptional regulator with GAF, ATPase, and Fis domain